MGRRPVVIGAAVVAVAITGVVLARRRRSRGRDEEDDGGDGDGEFEAPPGMLLLEQSRSVKGVQPIAFLVHAAHKARRAGDPERFALIAEQIELTLLECCEVVDEGTLEELAKALTEGVERSELLGTAQGVDGLAGFASICFRLKMAFAGLTELSEAAEAEISALTDLTEERLWESDDRLAVPDAPSDAASQLASMAAVERAVAVPRPGGARRKSRESKEAVGGGGEGGVGGAGGAGGAGGVGGAGGPTPDHLALLRERNRLLTSQVAQMQSMLVAGNALQRSMIKLVGGRTSMGHEEFMRRFPLAADEAERRLALKAWRLMDVVAPGCPEGEEVEHHVAALVRGEALRPEAIGGLELVGLMVTMMDDEKQHILSSYARDDTQVGRPFVSAKLGGGGLVLPRKCTKCQHVVASGEMVCLKGGVKGGGGAARAEAAAAPEAAAAAASKGGGPTQPPAEIASGKTMPSLIPSLMLSDNAVYEATGMGQSLAELVRASAFGHSDDKWRLMLSAFSDKHLYTGAPIFVGGHAVGALCAYTAAAKDEGPPAKADERLAQVLRENAAHIGSLLERFVAGRRAAE